MTKTQVEGCLYVVGTPIGNLEDITLRGLRVLAESSVIAAEDTRVTSKLLSRHGISTSTVSILGSNANRNIASLTERMRNGESVALVTDAGTPSVSDPGYDLVHAAVNADIAVTPVPGPSALAAAVSTAGLMGEGVRFFGFLPRKGRRRKELMMAIGEDTSVVVIYESPHRIGQTLKELAEPNPNRCCTLFREMTKLHEETFRGTLKEAAHKFSKDVRGEITLVIEGRKDLEKNDMSDDDLRHLVRSQLEEGRSVKDVSMTLSKGLGLPRKVIYEMAVSEMQQLSHPQSDK